MSATNQSITEQATTDIPSSNEAQTQPASTTEQTSKSSCPKQICILTGAGAEIDYGMPNGGAFSIGIFSNCLNKEAVNKVARTFKKAIEKVQKSPNVGDETYNQWLPDSLINRICTFNKGFFSSIMKDTITHNRDKILEEINKLTEKSDEKLHNIKQNLLPNTYDELPDVSFELNSHLKEEKIDEFFQCSLFKWLWSFATYQDDSDIELKTLLKKELGILYILPSLASGEALVHKLNNSFFGNKSSFLSQVFGDVGNIFSIDSSFLFDLVFDCLKHKPQDTGTDLSKVTLEVYWLLFSIFSSVLDYRSLIDTHWSFLYTPKDNWVDFRKTALFLCIVRDYIQSKVDASTTSFKTNTEGYYHQLAQAATEHKLNIAAVATTNYGSPIQEIFAPIDDGKLKVAYLNGSTELMYDPFLNRTVESTDLTTSNDGSEHLLVPLMITQNGTKPMTSTQMIKSYASTIDKWQHADALVVIGFGFTACDDNINSMIREALLQETNLIIVTVDDDESYYLNKLKLSNPLPKNLASRIKIIKIDKTDAKPDDKKDKILSNGKPFIDVLISTLNDMPPAHPTQPNDSGDTK